MSDTVDETAVEATEDQICHDGEGDIPLGHQSQNKAEDEKVLSAESKPDHLLNLCTDMFSKMSQYMDSEVNTTIEDYKLLEKMNVKTKEKYENMLEMAKSTGNNLHALNQKLADLQPYLDMIETIESKVMSLEKAAYKLDAYSKRLEERFKQIERR